MTFDLVTGHEPHGHIVSPLYPIMRLASHIQALAMFVAVWLTFQSGKAQSVAELIAIGDASDLTFHASEALRSYLPAERLEPGNVRLLVSISRQYRHLMADANTNEEKLRLGSVSLAYGLKAAALGPNDSEAQLSPAITYGKMLPFQGQKAQVDAAPRIKVAVDKALRLNPLNDTAWHVLGRWHQSLANVSALKRAFGALLYGKLPVGTNADAIDCFNRAIAINPHRLRHYIELGRTYAQMGQDATARLYIMKGLSMPNVEKDDPEVKLRGRETLGKLHG
jgi:tetratricopeptide (TPR) repeat protein